MPHIKDEVLSDKKVVDTHKGLYDPEVWTFLDPHDNETWPSEATILDITLQKKQVVENYFFHKYSLKFCDALAGERKRFPLGEVSSWRKHSFDSTNEIDPPYLKGGWNILDPYDQKTQPKLTAIIDITLKTMEVTETYYYCRFDETFYDAFSRDRPTFHLSEVSSWRYHDSLLAMESDPVNHPPQRDLSVEWRIFDLDDQSSWPPPSLVVDVCHKDGCWLPGMVIKSHKKAFINALDHHCVELSLEQVSRWKPYTARIEAEWYNVNHPPHYTALNAACSKCNSSLECIDITRHMNFNLGNAVKYLWRSDHKGNKPEDLKKAVWYIQDELEKLERSENNDSH